MKADLHLHTSCSDGFHSPQHVIDRAANVLDLISICDHDTLGAYRENPTIPKNLSLLPGLEMTCQVEEDDLHMLAYFPEGLNDAIQHWSMQLEDDRKTRVFEGVHKLRDQGIPLRWSDLEKEVGDSVPCRSHVARAMVQGDLCNTTSQAYRHWLGKGAFRRPQLTILDAITTVHSFKGLVFWAHPFERDLRKHGRRLVQAGIDGIETLYRNMSPSNRKKACSFQQEHQLGESGGSDLHQETTIRKIGQFSLEVSSIDSRLQIQKEKNETEAGRSATQRM